MSRQTNPLVLRHRFPLHPNPAYADIITPGIMRARHLIQRRPAIILRQAGVAHSAVVGRLLGAARFIISKQQLLLEFLRNDDRGPFVQVYAVRPP